MKKIFSSILALAIAAFTFTACEDVPEPYTVPGGGGTEVLPGNGDGTESNPYDVTAVKAKGSGTDFYVKGYIVGYVSGMSLSSGAVFSSDTCTVKSNLLIAETADETNVSKCLPIQLPSGAVRDGINLSQNKGNIKQEVILYGNIEKYFGATGIKGVTYAKLGAKEYGTKPSENPDTPSDEKTIFLEEFDNGQGGFTFSNVKMAPELSGVWKATAYNTSTYIIASAFANNTSYESEAWAVSPAINLKDSKVAHLNFRHAINKLQDVNRIPDMMTVWVSTDFAGDAAKATWKQIEVPNYPEGTSWTFVDAGQMDLTEYCGKEKVYVGFKYMSESGLSGSWEVDAFKITGDGTPMGSGTVTPEPDPDPNPGEDGKAVVTKAENVITMTAPGVAASGATVVCDLNTYGWASPSDPELVTLEDGTTISFAQEGGNNAPKFYEATKGVRMYALNSMTIKGSKAIAKVVVTCDVYNNTNQVGNDMLFATIAGNTWKMVNDHTGNSGGTQVRAQTIAITYAE